MVTGQPSRRQEKVARVIRESVSDTIANRLNDPRIKGLVSVTEVDVSPDLKNADVGLSIMGCDERHHEQTFRAIQHAGRHIQARLGKSLTSKFCPKLRFHLDTKLHKTLETLRLIDMAAREYSRPEDSPEEEDTPQEHD
jgi:ribosome-binding factor A